VKGQVHVRIWREEEGIEVMRRIIGSGMAVGRGDGHQVREEDGRVYIHNQITMTTMHALPTTE